MDNPEKLTTLGTQYTGQRQAKQQTEHRKLRKKKDEQHRPDQKPGVNPGARKG